jgi:hypothetical protein
MDAKVIAAGGHGGEELAEHPSKAGGRCPVEFNHLPEKVVRQKADAIRKEAEKQPHEEMGNGLGFMAALL